VPSILGTVPIFTTILGVLDVAFAWAMWLLQKRGIRHRGQATADLGIEDNLELQRIARDYHENYVTL
jgi:hypothetical protein